jgi:hypothetical protein
MLVSFDSAEKIVPEPLIDDLQKEDKKPT